MELVTDKLISELNDWSTKPQADGGIADILKIESVYFGDPGIIPVWLYTAIMVQPIVDDPASETTGYEIRNLELLITLVINSTEFFDKDVEEATGDRKLVQAAGSMRAWLRRVANRRLDGEAGNVREVVVDATRYMVEVRGSVIAKSAQLTLTVNKQYDKVRE
jgi:hypothetical protein